MLSWFKSWDDEPEAVKQVHEVARSIAGTVAEANGLKNPFLCSQSLQVFFRDGDLQDARDVLINIKRSTEGRRDRRLIDSPDLSLDKLQSTSLSDGEGPASR